MARRLSELERKARRRIQLITPENARKVLAKDIYWSREFLQLFLDRCDETAFEDPHAGLRLAEIAPDLVRCIRIGEQPGEFASPMDKRSSEVYARAVFGSALRRAEELTLAAEQYQKAFSLLDSGPITPRSEAELLSRFGFLKSVMGDDRALECFNRSLKLFAKIDDRPGAAQVLVLRADWFYRVSTSSSFGYAAKDLAKALSKAAKDPYDIRSKRVVPAALTNLARLLAEGKATSTESIAALPLIKQARKGLKRLPLPLKLRLLWVEGSLNRALHSPLQAVRLFEKVREGFRGIPLPYEFAVVSLEMAVTLLDEGDWEQLQELRKDTIATVRELTADKPDPIAMDFLSRWTVQSRRENLLEIKQALSS